MTAPRIIVRPSANLALYGRVGSMSLDEVNVYATKAKEFFDWQSHGFYNITVKGFLIEGDFVSTDKWSKQQVARVNHEGFIPDYHLVLGGWNQQRCGEAETPGEWGNVYSDNPTTDCKYRTVCHEHIHQLGIPHSGRISSVGGTLKSYGDTTDLMGSAAWYGLSAPKIHQLDWYQQGEEISIASNMLLRLGTLEQQWSDLESGEYRFAYIPHEQAYISLRKARTNTPFALSRLPDIAYVHWHDKTTGIDYRYDPDLSPGKSLQLKKGTIIEYLEYHDDNEQGVFNIIIPEKV